MKQYPSIGKDIIPGLKIYAFNKFDGSSLLVAWDRKNGFHKWGRRHGLLDDSNPILHRGPPSFLRLAPALDDAYRRERYESCITFMEFWGDESFAGNHNPGDQQLVSVFDIDVHRRGLLPPKEFLQVTQELDSIPDGRAQLLYYGNANEQFVNSVKDGTLPGMSLEGVVCKSQDGKMFKIKSDSWLSLLRQCCDTHEEFERLS